MVGFRGIPLVPLYSIPFDSMGSSKVSCGGFFISLVEAQAKIRSGKIRKMKASFIFMIHLLFDFGLYCGEYFMKNCELPSILLTGMTEEISYGDHS